GRSRDDEAAASRGSPVAGEGHSDGPRAPPGARDRPHRLPIDVSGHDPVHDRRRRPPGPEALERRRARHALPARPLAREVRRRTTLAARVGDAGGRARPRRHHDRARRVRPIVLGAVLAFLAAAPAAASAERSWGYAVSVYGYDVPSQDYVNANVTADRGHLHLEARYQYESIDTGSIWAGANFSAGESWTFDATMMLGVVFGDLDGVAP